MAEVLLARPLCAASRRSNSFDLIAGDAASRSLLCTCGPTLALSDTLDKQLGSGHSCLKARLEFNLMHCSNALPRERQVVHFQLIQLVVKTVLLEEIPP